MLENIVESARQFHWTETWAVIFGLIYIILIAQEKVWGWFWGIISCVLWAWATYNLYHLAVDAVLNLFYVVMGFVGIYQWKFGDPQKRELPITQMTVNQHILVIIIGLIFTGIVGYGFDHYTDAQKTYLDSLTTAFAIFATFMTIQKKIDNWIYWIIVDVLYIYIYGKTGAYLFLLLYIVYVVIALFGFLQWKKEMARQNN